MSDPGAQRSLLDERRYRATLVTGNPLELRTGAGVENELSATVFVFQLRSRQLACFLGKAHE